MPCMYAGRKQARKAKRKERRKTVPFFRHFDKLVMEQWFGREELAWRKDFGDSKGMSVRR